MSVSANRNPLDRPRVIIAALCGAMIGALFYNILPMYIGLAQDFRHLSSQQAGLIGSIFFLGYNVITMSAFFWIRRFDWRMIAAVAAPSAALSMAAGAYMNSYPMLLVSVFVAGGAFSTLYGLTATVLSDTTHVTRWFGLKVGLEALSGAIIFLIFPDLVNAEYGFDGFVLGLAAVVVVLSPALFFIPARGIKTQEEELAEAAGTESSLTCRPAIFAILFAIAFWFGGQTVMWSFVERFGNAGGHSADDVGMVLAATLLCALCGSLIAAAMGDKFGLYKSFFASSILYLVALPVLANSTEFSFYLVGACIVMFSVGFGVPYGFSITAALDKDGRYMVLAVPAIGIGAMVAPGLAGVLFADGNFAPVMAAGAFAVSVAMGLTFFSYKRNLRHEAQST